MAGVQPLVLVGAGGFGRETAEAVHAVNDERPAFDLLGFVDDAPELAGGRVDGLSVLGPVAAVRTMTHVQVVVCTGHPGNYTSRKRIVDALALTPDRFATVVHPAAILPRSVALGPGSVVLATAVATTAVRLGAHVAVMPGVVFTHDDVVGDYATFGAGARLAGRVQVREGAYLGAGALIREDRTIGAWSLVGMGSIVTRDVPPGEVWAGVPARRVRAADLPPDLQPGRAAS